jgi:protoheme IX farnesyltransferase
VVTAHLATALALFAVLVTMTTLITVGAGRGGESPAWAPRFQPWAIGGALAIYALMLTGSYVVGSGASLVSLDWPLVNNTLFPTSDSPVTERLLHIQWGHRVTVLLVGIALGVVAWKAIRTTDDPRIARLAWLTVTLYVIQIFVGAGNIWSRLNVVIAAAHLALASLVWAALVVMVVLTRLAVVRGRVPAVARELSTASRHR